MFDLRAMPRSIPVIRSVGVLAPTILENKKLEESG